MLEDHLIQLPSFKGKNLQENYVSTRPQDIVTNIKGSIYNLVSLSANN